METVSVVILNVDGLPWVLKCIESVFNSNYPGELEVILVDNGSSDDSVKKIKDEFGDAKVIENKENLGFATGNNIGIQASSGEYILILNNDALLGENSIEVMERTLRENTSAAIVGPVIIGGKSEEKSFLQQGGPKRPLEHFSGFFNINVRGGDGVLTTRDKVNYHPKMGPVDAVYGACFMIKRKVLEEIGLFDENFFIYNEELDLCLRAKKKGYSMAYTPDTIVYHKSGGTMYNEEFKISRILHGQKSMLYFVRKHMSFPIFSIFLGIQLVKFPFRSLIYLRNSKEEFKAFLNANISFLKHLISVNPKEPRLEVLRTNA